MSDRKRYTPALILDPENWPEAAINFKVITDGKENPEFEFTSTLVETEEEQRGTHPSDVKASLHDAGKLEKFVFLAVNKVLPEVRGEYHLDFESDYSEPDLRVFYPPEARMQPRRKVSDIVMFQSDNGLFAPSQLDEFNFRLILRDFHEALLEARTETD